MNKTILTEDVGATIKRLQAKDPGLKPLLKRAYGYAVFPSVGKAAAVIGGAYGHGVVFEQGKRIGYATIAQMTVGVQIGGDTFSEIVIFESKEAMDRFKKGKMAFAANASAVLVKAGASGTADYEKGITALAYSRGGMMLELAIGGQKFKFSPLGGAARESEEQNEAGEEEEGAEGEGAQDDGATGLLGRTVGGVRETASKAGGVARQHPVLTMIAGASLATGLALLVAKSVRRSQQDQDDSSEDQAQDEYEDEGQEQDEAEDAAGEEEAEPASDRGMKRQRVRSRA